MTAMLRARGLTASPLLAFALVTAACAPRSGAVVDLPRAPVIPPPAVSPAWRALVGEYGRLPVPDSLPGSLGLYLLERDSALWMLDAHRSAYEAVQVAGDTLRVGDPFFGRRAVIRRDVGGSVKLLEMDGRPLPRLATGPAAGATQLRITPVGDVNELRRIALTQCPPAESGSFLPTDLVEITSLDPTIRLEVRYATTNNFLGTQLYEQGRAFMQRPAAEALVRVHRALAPLGYGLLIHDAYRPWYVTKVFWDATPDSLRWLVANPAQGSRHNRGAAVDLTLFEVSSGRAVEMPSTYDEATYRAFSDYPGGTSRARWHRLLLRQAMEREGYLVNPREWWHFDYGDWRKYRIGNIPFAAIGAK